MIDVLLRVSVPPRSLANAEYDVYEMVIEMPAPPCLGMEIYMFSSDCGWSLHVGGEGPCDRLLWDATNKKYVVEHLISWGGDRDDKVRKLLSLGFKEMKP